MSGTLLRISVEKRRIYQPQRIQHLDRIYGSFAELIYFAKRYNSLCKVCNYRENLLFYGMYERVFYVLRILLWEVGAESGKLVYTRNIEQSDEQRNKSAERKCLLTYHFRGTMSTVSRAAVSPSAPIHPCWHVPRFFSRELLTKAKKANASVIMLFALLSAARL